MVLLAFQKNRTGSLKVAGTLSSRLRHKLPSPPAPKLRNEVLSLYITASVVLIQTIQTTKRPAQPPSEVRGLPRSSGLVSRYLDEQRRGSRRSAGALLEYDTAIAFAELFGDAIGGYAPAPPPGLRRATGRGTLARCGLCS